jgi:hypothetical protein
LKQPEQKVVTWIAWIQTEFNCVNWSAHPADPVSKLNSMKLLYPVALIASVTPLVMTRTTNTHMFTQTDSVASVSQSD